MWILKEDGSIEELVVTEFNEIGARMTPNGDWIAFASDESGRLEVYVQAYPGPGGRRLVSTDGGGEPVWSRDGPRVVLPEVVGQWAARRHLDEIE